jgi:hypothetical protein
MLGLPAPTGHGKRTRALAYSYWTVDAFNQEVAWPALSDRGHECLSLMIAYDSIGWSAIVREDESTTS